MRALTAWIIRLRVCACVDCRCCGWWWCVYSISLNAHRMTIAGCRHVLQPCKGSEQNSLTARRTLVGYIMCRTMCAHNLHSYVAPVPSDDGPRAGKRRSQMHVCNWRICPLNARTTDTTDSTDSATSTKVRAHGGKRSLSWTERTNTIRPCCIQCCQCGSYAGVQTRCEWFPLIRPMIEIECDSVMWVSVIWLRNQQLCVYMHVYGRITTIMNWKNINIWPSAALY